MRVEEIRARYKALFEVAAAQKGYFTSKQAAGCGYSRRVQHYHVKTGDWERVNTGVYRIKNFPVTQNEDLVRWSLWSRNNSDIPQGVISHDSALSFYELSDIIPAAVHLTVPGKFRKNPDGGCILHKRDLLPEDAKQEEGFKVTTPLRTILDSAEGKLSPEQLDRAIRDVFRKGMLVPASITKAYMPLKTREIIIPIIDRYLKTPGY